MTMLLQLLAEEGIKIRCLMHDNNVWEYQLSIIAEDWYGSFSSEEEAIRAALQHVIRLAIGVSDRVKLKPIPPVPPSVEQQRQVLTQRYMHLQMRKALEGIQSWPEINPQLEKLREEIDSLDAHDSKL